MGKGKGAPAAKAQKVIEDKTFGAKNKSKSKKVQQYVQNVQKQAEVNDSRKGPAVKSKKEIKAEKNAEFNEIFKPINTPKTKVEHGADPKSILCEFFRIGTCNKGARCKFSHDMSMQRKDAKVDLYTDRREDASESMDSWDDATLREVVDKKHGAADGRKPPSQIVCKYFLQAIEEKRYGWFWDCPNGGDKCQYRHALPPGFVLVSEKNKEEVDNSIPIEELVEVERRGLVGGTPMTYELFLKWKEQRKLKKEEEVNAKLEVAKKDRFLHGMSGRQMFDFKPELFVDDESGMDVIETRSRVSKQEVEEVESEPVVDDTVVMSTVDIGEVQIDESLFADELGDEDLSALDFDE